MSASCRFLHLFCDLLLIGFGLALPACCPPERPRVTGVTISAIRPDGHPDLLQTATTRLHPPLPTITVRPGTSPEGSGFPYNDPATGQIAITLGIGLQTFLLLTQSLETSGPFGISIFLDHETTPAFSVLSGPGSQAGTDRALRSAVDVSGAPVPGASLGPVVRRGMRISLETAEFPVLPARVDLVGAWSLVPDNIPDQVGRIALRMDPVR